jgi:hypothetical protein
VLDEPIPPAMLTLANRPQRWPAIAARIAAAAALGFLGGWLAQPRLVPTPAPRASLAPRLEDLGYRLIGGGRVALFIKTAPDGQAASAFRFVVENQGVVVFTWLDARFGYALSGTLDRDELPRLARKVHEQFSA